MRKHGSLCYFQVSSNYGEKEAMLRIAQVCKEKREKKTNKRREQKEISLYEFTWEFKNGRKEK